ncbi:MAG: lipopolysaccharide transport periplasmic protein LptA [Nitrosomonadales bacterium]|nr:lipopolysaccharide transport periplasmic protein LptA [Nitrosomonadales bacterium]
MPPQDIKKSPVKYATLLCIALACHAPASYAERADRDKPMHLEADRVNIDDARQISTFEGNVQITQGTLTIRGDRIVVTQDKDGFAHGTATGQLASFRQKREGLDEYVEGYGERIEYDAKNETSDLFGHAHMKREQDEVRGEHITYNSRTEIFQVHGASGKPAEAQDKGRVHAIIQPKNRNAVTGPAAEPLPIQPADTLTRPDDQGNSPP